MKKIKLLTSLLDVFKDFNSALDRIQQKMEILMATLQNFKDLVAGINTETDRLAAKIDAFIAGQNAGGMTPAEEDAALADLQAVSDRLKTIGADSTNPIPAEPPTI